MRTARSSSRPGGSPPRTPLRDQTPPGIRHPSMTRHPPGTRHTLGGDYSSPSPTMCMSSWWVLTPRGWVCPGDGYSAQGRYSSPSRVGTHPLDTRGTTGYGRQVGGMHLTGMLSYCCVFKGIDGIMDKCSSRYRKSKWYRDGWFLALSAKSW